MERVIPSLDPFWSGRNWSEVCEVTMGTMWLHCLPLHIWPVLPFMVIGTVSSDKWCHSLVSIMALGQLPVQTFFV